MKIRKAPVSAVLALTLLAACSGAPEPEPLPPPTPTPTATPEPQPEPEPEPEPEYWPLTGLETHDLVERPAVSVKIENTAAARPQMGLDSADMVWETIIDFDVSRFIAVYHSELPEEIGPIRSVRPTDPAIISPLGGLIAFSGGQEGVLNLIRASQVQPLSHDSSSAGFYRVPWRRAPHNVYGSLEAFLAQADADHQEPPAEQFKFAHEDEEPTAIAKGENVEVLNFVLSRAARPSWTWDADEKGWLRSEGTAPHLDHNEKPLAAVNVVSITAPHVPSGFTAQNRAVVPTYELIGEGAATVATGGKIITGIWKKQDANSPFTLETEDGDEILLAPGNTWVELVPKGKGSLTY